MNGYVSRIPCSVGRGWGWEVRSETWPRAEGFFYTAPPAVAGRLFVSFFASCHSKETRAGVWASNGARMLRVLVSTAGPSSCLNSLQLLLIISCHHYGTLA